MMPSTHETLLYSTPDVRVGTFRCRIDDPEFRTAGPIEGYTIAFPRSAVWIQHEGHPPFVADPLVVTVYNKHQPYVRLPLAPDGDRVDWFSVSQPLALAVAEESDPAAAEHPDRPFRIRYAASDALLYRRQRVLLQRIHQGGLEPLAVEHEVATLVAATLLGGAGRSGAPWRAKRRSAQRDLVEGAKAELARDVTVAPRLRDLAARLDASPFHLCRIFRRWTGSTLHGYLLDLRVRIALERLGQAPADLSRLAHGLGFSSHSHFSAAFRRRMGAPPSRIRNVLLAGSAQSDDSAPGGGP